MFRKNHTSSCSVIPRFDVIATLLSPRNQPACFFGLPCTYWVTPLGCRLCYTALHTQTALGAITLNEFQLRVQPCALIACKTSPPLYRRMQSRRRANPVTWAPRPRKQLVYTLCLDEWVAYTEHGLLTRQHASLVPFPPLSSRHHLSYDDCLEDKTETKLSVLCTTAVHNNTHTWVVLTADGWFYV